MRVKYLAQEHNAMLWPPGFEPGQLNLEASALTLRLLHLIVMGGAGASWLKRSSPDRAV